MLMSEKHRQMKTDESSLEHLVLMNEKHFQMKTCYLMAVEEYNTAAVEVDKSVFQTVVLLLQIAGYKTYLVQCSYSLFLHYQSCYSHYSAEERSMSHHFDKPLDSILCGWLL